MNRIETLLYGGMMENRTRGTPRRQMSVPGSLGKHAPLELHGSERHDSEEDRYRAISEVVSDWAYSLLVYPDGRSTITWTDMDAVRITGYGSRDLDEGAGWLGLVHPDDRTALRRHQSALLAGRTDIAEYRIVTRSGEVRWVRDYARPLDAVGDGVMRVVGGVRDVTARRQAEADRARLISELEATNEELERIALSVSQELLRPLEAVAQGLAVLDRRLPEAGQGDFKRDVQRAIGAVEHLRDMLAQLDELARIGHLPENLERVSLADLASLAVDLCRDRIQDRDVRVEIRELPEVIGDRIRLLKLLRILVENAAQYSGDQPQPRLELGARSLGTKHVLYVRDNGAGIAPGDLEKVFDVFRRLDSREAGTGVGLALARRIAEMHGGRIWAESAGQGQGSTFLVELPA